MRGKTITISKKAYPTMGKLLAAECIASAGPYANITGMRNLYWGKECLIIRYGSYIYNMGKSSRWETRML